VRRVVLWDVKPCSIAACFFARLIYSSILKMEVVLSSETSANFYRTTRRLMQDDSNFHSLSRDNVKSYEKEQCGFLECMNQTVLFGPALCFALPPNKKLSPKK
jgi:hypothetical protein